MPTPWALTPLKSPFASGAKPLGGGASAPNLQTAYQPPTTGYSVPLSGSTTYQRYQPPAASRDSALSTLGQVGMGGGAGQSQPTQRNPYSQPSGASSPSPTSTPRQQPNSNLTQPGEYENWYRQNAGRYNQPTSLSSYWSSVQGRVQGQRFQPTTARDAYGQMRDAYSQPGQGMTNAYGVSGQLRNQSQGEGVMNAATSYFSGPNNMSQYYGDNRDFFNQAGDIENYYDANGQRFQQAGFGEQNAQGILSNQNLTGLYDNRLVGDELDYFRPELRNKSYSEQLYESGNQGLNTYYDRAREKAQQDLADRMAATGLFGSGETAQGMYEINAELGAQQARDMAALAAQGDLERRSRADLLSGMAGAAADEELGRGDLMLRGAETGLQLDRDAISRLYQGGQLADMSSRYGLDRVAEGGRQARSADESLFEQGRGLGELGRSMSDAERLRLVESGRLGLDADEEERLRLDSLFGAGRDTDQLGLDADRNELDWLEAGGRMAGDVDRTNLEWLNAGGGAADRFQTVYENRERNTFQDPLSAADSISRAYGQGSNAASSEERQMREDGIKLLMDKRGMSADEAEAEVDRLWKLGQLGTLFAGGG